MMMMTMEQKHHFLPNTKSCSLLLLLLHCFLFSYPFIIVADIYLPRCSSPDKFTTNNSAYQSNVATLLSSFSSTVTASATNEFYNATVGITNTAYGLYMCRGDISHELCRDCITNATQKVASYCKLAKQAILWHDYCMVRYSNRPFFSRVEEQPQVKAFHWKNVSDNVANFTWILATTLNQVAAEAAGSGPAGVKKFATREAHVWSEGGPTLYTMAQCTPDLLVEDCSKCLNDAIGQIAGCCLGRIGGRIVCPSCKVRFESYQFYNVSPTLLRSPYPFSKGKKRFGSQIFVLIVVIAIVSVVFFVLGVYFLRKRARKHIEAVLRENLIREATTTLGSLQFSLATIKAATNKFSPENKMGMSGSGEIYKGVLPHGQEITVKRFSNHSSQDFIEFRNEILLIAKLQHRNLVALLGFYLDEQEKILVYEYVPNKNLEYFLFDSHEERRLSWCERFQIIKGLAGAILYLHDHSRLKVIHCDLRPSNILLDNNMIPKISDFCASKTLAVGEVNRRTNKIIGTRGYMSPEYARLGKFSEKSDIFSFGVIILEIITGRRNTSHELRSVNGLLNYVWKEWSGQTPLQILDSNINDSYCEAEVTKCIQIGLLCVQEDSKSRPSISTIVSYISSFSIKLPSPQEPAFFIHPKKEPIITIDDESSSEVQADMNNSMACSNNNVTLSSFLPR